MKNAASHISDYEMNQQSIKDKEELKHQKLLMEAKYPLHGIYTDLMNREQREANEMAAHDL